jgi:hypothetical protein
MRPQGPTVTAEAPSGRHAPSDEQARREVAIYLQAWLAMNPGDRADIVV